MPTFGHSGSKWQLRAKPEQPQTLPPACLASGTFGFAGFGLFLNQPMLNCLNSPRAPTKAAGTSSVPALLSGPASAPGVSAQAGLQPRLLPVPGAGGSCGTEPGAGPAPFHKCLIPAQSRSSATHKHLSPSSHPGVPAAPRQLLPPLQPAEEKRGWGDPTEPPQADPPRPPQHGGCWDHPTHPCLGLDILVLTLYDNKVGFYFQAGGRRVLVCVCLCVTGLW